MLDINVWVKALNTKADEQRAAGTFVNLYETFKTFWVYERLDKDRKKYIDQFLLYEFGSSNSYSSYMSELYLASFLLFLNEGYLPFNPDDIDCEKYRSFSWRITDKMQKIVFAKPTKINEENTKPTKDKHGYPLDKDHTCFPTSHAMSVLFEWDNGSSKTVQRRCTRCGHEELDQYDYN